MSNAKYWNTTAFRVAVVYGLMFFIAIIALMGVVYWRTIGYISNQVDESLQRNLEQLQHLPASALPATIASYQSRDSKHLNFYGVFKPLYGVFDHHHRWLAGNLATVPNELSCDQIPRPVHRYYLRSPDSDVAVDSLQEAIALCTPLPSGNLLVMGRNITPMNEIRRIIIQALLEGGGGAIFLGVVASFLLGIRSMRRINRLRDQTERIANGDLNVRLEVSRSNDELDLLASVINSMLAKVEVLMLEVRHVCNNIAHDLRTPMTRIRSKLHRLQQSLPEDEQALIDEVVQDTDRVLARFTALLRIAEIESHKRRSAFTVMQLSEVLRQLLDLYGPLSEEKHIHLALHCMPVGEVEGDAELIFEAVSNLLDNAIKFAPENSIVHVDLTTNDKGPVLDIINQKTLPSPVAKYAGQGLGLSIVEAIMRLHQYEFSLQEQDQAYRARIRFE